MDLIEKARPGFAVDGFGDEFIRYIHEKDVEVSKRGDRTYAQEDLEDIARHFAQWQKEKDEEIINAIGDIPGDIEKAYHNGRKDMREQMMKEAVEGYVAQRVHGELFAKCQVPKSMNLQFSDKVRIIIVKED